MKGIFQCELGSAIKMFFINDENIEVLYEMYYPTDNPTTPSVLNENDENKETLQTLTKTKRNYTDIVICDIKIKEYIAIELKHALSDTDSNKNKRFEYVIMPNGDIISIAKRGP